MLAASVSKCAVRTVAPHFRLLVRQIATRTLGATGFEVSEISLGGAGFGAAKEGQIYGGVSTDEAVGCILRAIERGINFFDVAPLYAEGEARLGHVLKEISTPERDRLIISTKVGDECAPFSNNGGHCALSTDGILYSFEHSLRQLHTDRVEVLLLHDPTTQELEQFLKPGGGIEAMCELKRQGAIGSIGLGCVELEHHLAFMEHNAAEVLLTVNDFNVVRRRAEKHVYPAARRKEIGAINAGVFYMGLLGGHMPRESFAMGFKSGLEVDALLALAERIYCWAEAQPCCVGLPPGMPLRRAALDFALTKNPAVSTCLIGCRTAVELDQVLDAHELPALSAEYWSKFDEEFGDEIAAFPDSEHWFYSKEASDIGN